MRQGTNNELFAMNYMVPKKGMMSTGGASAAAAEGGGALENP
jgi:hypothetical protein